MARIKYSGECDCETCEGSYAPQGPNGEVMFGGWVCNCPCHTTGKKQDNKELSEMFKNLGEDIMAQLENYREPYYTENELKNLITYGSWNSYKQFPEWDQWVIIDFRGRYQIVRPSSFILTNNWDEIKKWQYFDPPCVALLDKQMIEKYEQILNKYRKDEQDMYNQENHKLDEELLNKINKLEEVYGVTSVLTLYGDGSGDLGFVDPNDPCISEDVFHFDNMEEFHQKVDRHIYRVKGPKQSYEDEYEDQLKLGDEDNIIDWDDHCRFEDNSLDLVGIFADHFYCPDFKYEAEVVDKLRQIEKIQPIKSRQVAATIFGLMNNVKLKEKVR